MSVLLAQLPSQDCVVAEADLTDGGPQECPFCDDYSLRVSDRRFYCFTCWASGVIAEDAE